MSRKKKSTTNRKTTERKPTEARKSTKEKSTNTPKAAVAEALTVDKHILDQGDVPGEIVFPSHFTPLTLAAYRLGVRIGQALEMIEPFVCRRAKYPHDLSPAATWARGRIAAAYARLRTEMELDAIHDDYQEVINELREAGSPADRKWSFRRLYTIFDGFFSSSGSVPLGHEWFLLGTLAAEVGYIWEGKPEIENPLRLKIGPFFGGTSRFFLSWRHRMDMVPLLERLNITPCHLIGGDGKLAPYFTEDERDLLHKGDLLTWPYVEGGLKAMEHELSTRGSGAAEDPAVAEPISSTERERLLAVRQEVLDEVQRNHAETQQKPLELQKLEDAEAKIKQDVQKAQQNAQQLKEDATNAQRAADGIVGSSISEQEQEKIERAAADAKKAADDAAREVEEAKKRLEGVNRTIKQCEVQHVAQSGRPTFLGDSQPILRLFEEIKRFGKKHTPVLILGERGTGKSTLAKIIHYYSGRPGVLTEERAVMSSGNSTAALAGWTGIGKSSGLPNAPRGGTEGILQAAGDGSILIDELENASVEFQAMLLPLLEGKEVRKAFGSGDERIKPNGRLILATNKQREELEIREDLIDRIPNIVTVPPLRDRKEDILTFVRHWQGDFKSTRRFEVTLLRYSWPGNVRELDRVIEMARDYAKEGELTLQANMLKRDPELAELGKIVEQVAKLTDKEAEKESLSMWIEYLSEKGYRKNDKDKPLQKTLATILGETKETMSRRLKKYGL